jgi:peptidoglycan/LPS O-acetylase OafA/YrhL
VSENAPTPTSSAWTRLDGIDVLRGLAILFVLLNHINLRLTFGRVAYADAWPHQLVSSLMWNGQRGVQIFFAVSGFLICSMTLRRWPQLKKVDLAGFYRLRFARIAPLLLLLLAVLSILHLQHIRGYVVPEKTGGLWRALLAALTFHINVLEARRGYLPPNWDILWSLSVEETFYLFFPLVCRLLGRGKWLLALLWLFVALGPLSRALWSHGNETWREYSYLGSMDAIALGCLTALALARLRLSNHAPRLLAALGAVVLVFSLGFSDAATRLGLERSGLDMTVLAIGASLVIAAAAATHWRGPNVLAPLLWVGRRSYEIYLTHMFVVMALFAIFVNNGKRLWAVPILFVSVILLSSLLGGLIARFCSEPLNRRLRENLPIEEVLAEVHAAPPGTGYGAVEAQAAPSQPS